MSQIHDLTRRVIGSAMRVHRELGRGFLESVYQNALCVELRLAGINYSTNEPINVQYRQTNVGSFIADILIEDCLILELKAVEKLHPAHEVQLVHYLKATGIDDGLLINFGAASLDFKHKYRNPKPALASSSRSPAEAEAIL
jgi:GxxExxY protein